MNTHAERMSFLDTTITDLGSRGLTLQTAEDAELDGRSITLGGRRMVSFSSCSYLGLELDPRLEAGVCAAVRAYGTQFSASRSYVSAPLYACLEERLSEMFGGPTAVAASTSLGHLAALPVLVEPEDAVVVDQLVHHSVHAAVNQLRTLGITVDLMRHNSMDALERRLERLGRTHRRVWYLGDGVYSMYADLAPVEELNELLARHEQLHLYLDDSHGLGWAGRNGSGTVLDRLATRERTVVALSLNKSFAAAGGALVFPDAETKRRVRACGGTFMFSGPVQPPMLGAALASAEIHLSPEIAVLQARLRERVDQFNALAEEAGLPLVAPSHAPIRFVGCGLPAETAAVAERMLADGLYVNVAMFPAVAMKRGGVRMTLTLHHTPQDVERLVDGLARQLPAVLAEHGSSLEKVRATFGLAAAAPEARRECAVARPATDLRLERAESIDALDAAEWDALLGDAGSFTAEGLRFLERCFGGNERPEDDWGFAYYLVRDARGRVVLATFFTEALWKDDMLAPAEVSRRVEELREEDPYLLTSKAFAMGSLLTEGDHLYLDRGADWRAALALLLDAVESEQERRGAASLVLRDFDAEDAELGAFLRERGLVALPLEPSYAVELDFATEEERLARLSERARRLHRREVLAREADYEVEILTAGGREAGREELAHLHRLYRNVQERAFALNSFPLPPRVFAEMLRSPSWELVLLRLAPEAGGPTDGRPVAVGAHFVGPRQYAPLVVGLDYDYVESHGAYRQALLQAVRRGRRHGAARVLLGMGAGLEKRRVGAEPRSRCAYARAADHFSAELLASLEADLGARPAALAAA